MRKDKRFQRPIALPGSVIEGHVVRKRRQCSPACLAVLVTCSFLVPGCAVFSKKSPDTNAPATGAGSGTPPAKFPTSGDPLLGGGNASQAYGGAVLAGRVFDNYSKPPANTSIQLVGLDGKETGNPKEVNVTPDGYFIIQGLKSGASYKLLARGKNGDHLLAGITYAKAPNLTVVIQVKEDLATSATPDVQGTPAFQDKNPAKTSGLNNPNNSGNAWPNIGQNGGQAGSELQLPAVQVPGPGPAPPAPASTYQGWVPGPNVASDKGSTLPLLDVPNPTIKPALPPLRIHSDPQMPPPASAQPNPAFPADSRLGGPALVPSCVLVGNQLVNFALNDVNGEAWEFKKNRRGKLILIDFWSTTCTPCLQTIPTIKNIQSKYASQGLEVIGIAVEAGEPPQVLAYKVDSMARRLKMNYRQLLSTSTRCPVCEDLKIDGFPTMILVDHEGNILWRHKGILDSNAVDYLHRLIQGNLRAR
jgi:thiol-disulfide isomerase/thioredoxin